MGCDIHFYVEKQNEQGAWVSAEEWVDEYGDECLDVKYDKRFYTGRNYDLFAMLADVRNGVGFAGVDTGDSLVPIDQPRGLPDDVSAEVKQCSDRWDIDGHSHSYFTLEELQNYDLDQTSVQRGTMSLDTYLTWKESGENWPQFWFGGGGGKNVAESEIKDMTKEQVIEKYGESVNIRAEWSVPYSQAGGNFFTETLPKMAELNDDATKVRAVFWFDN